MEDWTTLYLNQLEELHGWSFDRPAPSVQEMNDLLEAAAADYAEKPRNEWEEYLAQVELLHGPLPQQEALPVAETNAEWARVFMG